MVQLAGGNDIQVIQAKATNPFCFWELDYQVCFKLSDQQKATGPAADILASA